MRVARVVTLLALAALFSAPGAAGALAERRTQPEAAPPTRPLAASHPLGPEHRPLWWPSTASWDSDSAPSTS